MQDICTYALGIYGEAQTKDAQHFLCHFNRELSNRLRFWDASLTLHARSKVCHTCTVHCTLQCTLYTVQCTCSPIWHEDAVRTRNRNTDAESIFARGNCTENPQYVGGQHCLGLKKVLPDVQMYRRTVEQCPQCKCMRDNAGPWSSPVVLLNNVQMYRGHCAVAEYKCIREQSNNA